MVTIRPTVASEVTTRTIAPPVQGILVAEGATPHLIQPLSDVPLLSVSLPVHVAETKPWDKLWNLALILCVFLTMAFKHSALFYSTRYDYDKQGRK